MVLYLPIPLSVSVKNSISKNTDLFVTLKKGEKNIGFGMEIDDLKYLNEDEQISVPEE